MKSGIDPCLGVKQMMLNFEACKKSRVGEKRKKGHNVFVHTGAMMYLISKKSVVGLGAL